MRADLLVKLLMVILAGSCTTVRPTDVRPDCETLGRGNKEYVLLVKEKEPGDPLVIYGKVIDGATHVPVRNARLFLYHTDHKGHYRSWFFGYPPAARIRGSLRTDSSGCFKIRTILPGDYPGAINNRHIHFVLKAKGYKTTRKEFLFEGFLNDEMRTHAIRDSSGIILNITRNEKNGWVGAANLYLDR